MTYNQVRKVNKRNQKTSKFKESLIGLAIVAFIILMMMLASDGPTDTIQLNGWQGTTSCWAFECYTPTLT